MTTQHTDEMREAFERFYVQKYGYSPAACLNQRNADGSYSPPDREYQQIQDQRAWEAYQAATASTEAKYLTVIREQHEALIDAKRALAMLGAEIPNLKAVRDEKDPRLATPANYAAELAKMAKSLIEPALALAAPYRKGGV